MNDFLLKPIFHTWLTGKLSDFAGLFIFPLFWSALIPGCRKCIYTLTALGFIFWKSSYSTVAVEWWNTLAPFRVGRTVDYGDLFALLILPPSYLYRYDYRHLVPRRLAKGAVITASVFAFTATTLADEQSTSTLYGREYNFATGKANLLERLMKDETLFVRRADYLDSGDGEHHVVVIKRRFCKGGLSAFVEVSGGENRSSMKLLWIDYRCDEPQPEQELLNIFEEEVVKKLPPSPAPTVAPTPPAGKMIRQKRK